MNTPYSENGSSFSYEELNEIADVSRQCGVNVRGLREHSVKNQSCKMILKGVARIQEEYLNETSQNIVFDVHNNANFVRQGGMLIPSSTLNIRIKQDVLRKIENLVD